MEFGTTASWCRATGGTLTPPQRRLLLTRIVRQYPVLVRDTVRLLTGVSRPTAAVGGLPTPDVDLLGVALTVCEEQGPQLQGHGLRTWLLGSLLAARADVTVDADELLVAAVAHDVGLAHPVPGEDFTLRSGDAAVAAFAAAGRPLDGAAETRVRDAVVAHTTPGVRAATSPLGWVLQTGATADLLGLGLADLPATVVDQVYAQIPQDGMRTAITRAVAAESAAVPAGRFALLRMTGFSQAVLAAPHRLR